MMENTPPSSFAKDALSEGDENDGKHLKAENKGLKQKLLEYEQENNDLRQKVAHMVPYYQEVINLAKNVNVPLAVSVSPIQSTPPAGLHPTESSNTTESKIALQNDLIVCDVLRHLESEDLLRCRLVNHLWNSHATLHLRKFHPYIGFGSVEKVADFVRTANNATWSTRFPYSQFLIQNQFVPGMAAQFALFAQYIKVLRITSPGTYSSHKNSVYLHTIPAILKMMVNLEKLELSQIPFSKHFPDSVPKPTFTIPSLKTLQIEANFFNIYREGNGASYVVGAENPKSDQIVQNILGIGALKRITLALTLFSYIPKFMEALTLIPCLEELEVSSISNESHLQYLLKDPKPFALKSLKLTIQLESCTTLLRLLETHALTLESLELHLGARGVPNFLPPNKQFPKFPNLRNLKLLSSLNGPIFPFCPSQEGGEFPLLSKLHLSDNVYALFFASTPRVWFSAGDLILSSNPCCPRLGSLIAINGAFLNLKKVTLNTTNPYDLRDVISNYPNLESLEFGPIMNITEVLIGIPQPAWIEQDISLECEVNSLSKCFAINFLQRTATSRGIGLHLLTQLKRLEIKGQQDGNCTVKDVLGYGVLLALPRLEYLAITNAELSESCVKDLRKHHANDIIKTEELPRNRDWRTAFEVESDSFTAGGDV